MWNLMSYGSSPCFYRERMSTFGGQVWVIFAFKHNTRLKMSGIYIHIPFCKQACVYCNFYFSTSLGNKDNLVNALIKEIELSRDYLQGEKIETIYFGGGTP